MRKSFALLASALALGAATPALAQQVYSAPTNPGANQNWSGSLGLDFTVNSAVSVTSLGAFDSGLDGIASDLFVGIYTSTGTLVSPLVNLRGTANTGNAYNFVSVAPFLLGPGSYQIAAWGYGAGEGNYNSYGGASSIVFDTLGGALTAVGTHYNNSNVTGFANQNVDVGAERYGAGSFVAAPVPEPASWAMMVGGFGVLGVAARRRRRAKISFA